MPCHPIREIRQIRGEPPVPSTTNDGPCRLQKRRVPPPLVALIYRFFFVPFVFLVVPVIVQSTRDWVGSWKPIRRMGYLTPLMRSGLRQSDFGRVGLGGLPPRPPTDPDVQNSSIRFFTSPVATWLSRA